MPTASSSDTTEGRNVPLRSRDRFILALVALTWLALLIPTSWNMSDSNSGSKKEGVPVQTGNANESDKVFSFQLDLNQASADELTLLPGIGEKTAAKIIAVRSELGGFQSQDQLLQVHGIGPKTLQKISVYIRPFPDEPAPFLAQYKETGPTH